jgi:hypothetical protein
MPILAQASRILRYSRFSAQEALFERLLHVSVRREQGIYGGLEFLWQRPPSNR